MTTFKHTVAVIIALTFMAACAPQMKKKDYTKFRAENPKSILILPVVNNTVDVDAPRYFLATVSVPVAERGYYVFPVNLVRGVMNEEGLSDANLVHNADPVVLGDLFGADGILYISIEHWETQYIVISATTIVSFTYVLKSGRTGEEIWREKTTMRYSPQASGGGLGGLIGQAVAAAIQKAAPNYMPLARQANAKTITFPGVGFPAGPYDENHGGDLEAFASLSEPSTSTEKERNGGKAETAPENKANTPSEENAPSNDKRSSKEPVVAAPPGTFASPGLTPYQTSDRNTIQEVIVTYYDMQGGGDDFPDTPHGASVQTVNSMKLASNSADEIVANMRFVAVEGHSGAPHQKHKLFYLRKDGESYRLLRMEAAPN